MSMLCLFFFFQHLIVYYILPNMPVVTIGLQLAEFAIIFYLIRLMIHSAQVKYLLNMVLVSFLSVIITIYTIKDVQTYSSPVYLIQALLITLLAIVALLGLINNNELILATEPAFWIACGLIAYGGMSIFVEGLAGFSSNVSPQTKLEKQVVLAAAAIFRLILFTVAARQGRDPITSSREYPPQ